VTIKSSFKLDASTKTKVNTKHSTGSVKIAIFYKNYVTAVSKFAGRRRNFILPQQLNNKI